MAAAKPNHDYHILPPDPWPLIGAICAGLLFGGSINAGITIETFLYSLIGAIILLAIVNLILTFVGLSFVRQSQLDTSEE